MNDDHLTSIPFILANIDEYQDGRIRGWVVDTEVDKPLAFNRLRFLQNGRRVPRYIYGLERTEIAQLYNNEDYLGCGFEIYPEGSQPVHLECLDGDEWKTLHVSQIPELTLSRDPPNLITIDNFYLSPEKVRKFALNQEFVSNGERKGFRSAKEFTNDETKRRFEEILNLQIEKWDYPGNGAFYYYTQYDNLIIDSNGNDFVALLFLNPQTPNSFGINFYRKKERPEEYYDEFSDLEKLDFIGSRYNRLVIFRHDLLNTISEKFGKEKEDSFLFQFFVFTVKN